MDEISEDAKSFMSLALPAGVFSIHLIEAKSLVNRDFKILGQGISDPYAKVKIMADGLSHFFKTETVKDNLNPVWKLLIDLPVDDPDTMEDLPIEVWDEDKVSKDDFLGSCVIPSTTLRTAIATGAAQASNQLL